MKKSSIVLTGLMIVGFAFACTADDQKKAEGGELEHPIRNVENAIVTIETDQGNLTMELYRDIAPAHADSFLARVKDGFYDSTQFHRIVKGFMAQGGNAKVVGRPGVKYSINAEFNDLPHKEGTLSAARTPDINSASTQFFLWFGRNRSTAGLDNKYTNYGQLLMGYDVLHKIEAIKTGNTKWTSPQEKSGPLEPAWIFKAYESDAYGNAK